MSAFEPFPLGGKAARCAQHASPMGEVAGEKPPLSRAFGDVTFPPLCGRNV